MNSCEYRALDICDWSVSLKVTNFSPTSFDTENVEHTVKKFIGGRGSD